MTQETHQDSASDSSTEIPYALIPQDGSAPPAPSRRRSGCLWGIGGALGCFALVLLIPTVLTIIGVTSFSTLISGIGTALGAGASAPVVAEISSSQTIVQGIQPLGQLVSVSSQLAKADVEITVGQGVLNACGFSANHVVQGTVEAGIDLTLIGETDLAYDEQNDRYVLIVPAPQLTSCRIDYIRQYDRSMTTCAVDWDEARLLANYESLVEFRDDAIEGGILIRAEQEARLVLGNFIRLLTGKPVEIVFEPSSETVQPPSCSPDTPAGWRFNPQNRHWEK
ncbi:MAG: DUF4230 domain-containing protein [Anaerolineae bacterium]|nr:DUF4230 domain-containing protein [Anaerolineae bacterium]NUQ03811.1 DUF4230 domain-containing protein [Anaerolineae bacterium]